MKQNILSVITRRANSVVGRHDRPSFCSAFLCDVQIFHGVEPVSCVPHRRGETKLLGGVEAVEGRGGVQMSTTARELIKSMCWPPILQQQHTLRRGNLNTPTYKHSHMHTFCNTLCFKRIWKHYGGWRSSQVLRLGDVTSASFSGWIHETTFRIDYRFVNQEESRRFRQKTKTHTVKNH